MGAKCWNAVPIQLRGLEDSGSFNKTFKNRLIGSLQIDPNYSVNNAFDNYYETIEVPESHNVPEQIRVVLNSVVVL